MWNIETHESAGRWSFTASRGSIVVTGDGFDSEDAALLAMRDTLTQQAGESEPEKPKNKEKPINLIFYGTVEYWLGQPILWFVSLISITLFAGIVTVLYEHYNPVSKGCLEYIYCTEIEKSLLQSVSRLTSITRIFMTTTALVMSLVIIRAMAKAIRNLFIWNV